MFGIAAQLPELPATLALLAVRVAKVEPGRTVGKLGLLEREVRDDQRFAQVVAKRRQLSIERLRGLEPQLRFEVARRFARRDARPKSSQLVPQREIRLERLDL